MVSIARVRKKSGEKVMVRLYDYIKDCEKEPPLQSNEIFKVQMQT